MKGLAWCVINEKCGYMKVGAGGVNPKTGVRLG